MKNNILVQMPCVDEQRTVASYLDSLDNLIALHQSKCDDLQEVKKYMLQKLFPQNGAKIPEIRFAGFTGEWEQRKLGDVFQEYSEKRHEELPPLTIFQGGGTILREESDRNLQYDKSSLSNYKMVKKDDFIVIFVLLKVAWKKQIVMVLSALLTIHFMVKIQIRDFIIRSLGQGNS